MDEGKRDLITLIFENLKMGKVRRKQVLILGDLCFSLIYH